MKVLYFTRDYSPHDERFLTALALTEHEVHFLRLEPHQAVNPIPGVHEMHFPQSEGIPAASDEDNANTLHHILNDLKPDIVHAGPLHGPAYIASLTRFPRLVSMSWGADILHAGEIDPKIQYKIQHTLDHSLIFVCDCQAVADKASRDYGYPSDRVFQFPWGVDLDHFTPIGSKSLRYKLGWENNFVFLSNRSFEPIYGVDVTLRAFIRAAENDPHIRLLLYGKGSQEKALRSLVRETGVQDKVHFGGFLDRAGLPDLYRSADVFLSASHCDGSSVSLMEALACGLPVIVSDIPGNLEWVRDGVQGWVFSDGDINQMAALMRTARHEPALAGYRTRTRAFAELRADWRHNFLVLLNAYEKARQTGVLVDISHEGRE